MSNKILVKFDEAGKWADDPADPVFKVEAGEEKEVSARLANIIVDAGKGELVTKKVVNEGNDNDEPKDGDACVLDDDTEGVIKDGECVKKGFLGFGG